MSYFVKEANAVLTIINNKPVWFRDVNVLIEDESLKCIGRDCEKPRGSILINGVDKVVTPSPPNVLIDPKSILAKNIDINDSTNYSFVRALTRAICLVHLMNGLMGFISFGEIAIDPNVCLDLSIKVRVVKKAGLRNGGFGGNNLYGLDLCDDRVVKQLEDVLVDIIGKGRLVLVKTSINKHNVFLIKKTFGLFPLEILYKRNLLSNETLVTHLNWVSLSELNIIREVKPTIVVSPSTSLYLGERGFTPINQLFSMKTPIALTSDLYYVNRFDLFREFQLLSLMMRHLFNGFTVDYDDLFINTFASASRILGYSVVYEDKVWIKPSLTIHRLVKPGLNDTTGNTLLDIAHSRPEFVFIDGKPIFTPFNVEELVLELYTIFDTLRGRGV